MIEPISAGIRAYHPSYAKYGVTKFIAKDGEGHRGIILQVSDDGKTALLWGITAEYSGVVVKVKENDPDRWPEEVEQIYTLHLDV